MDDQIFIRPIKSEDHPWMREELRKWWGVDCVITWKTKYDLIDMSGFIAMYNNAEIGLVVIRYENKICEIMSLTTSSSLPQIGIRLIAEVIGEARKNKSERIIVVTTNDNTSALLFYQKIGFYIHQFRKNIVEESRKIKPEIPIIGNHHIPNRDEIELEMVL